MRQDPVLSDLDRTHLLRAIALAEEARLAGNRPFGTVIVSGSGEVLCEALNTAATSRDASAHAEMAALRSVGPRTDRPTLAGCTVYASGEPCPMCASAIYTFGIRRVVFGLDEAALRTYRKNAGEPGGLQFPCRDIFATGTERTEVIGPALLEQARQPHDLYWLNVAAGKKAG